MAQVEIDTTQHMSLLQLTHLQICVKDVRAQGIAAPAAVVMQETQTIACRGLVQWVS